MNNIKKDYLTLDGITIDDQLRKNLNNSGVFTDQNYDGSNLSVINKNMAYGFSLLLYYLNQTAHAGLFSETDVWENMNRILKLTGYKPLGYQTSYVPVEIVANNTITTGIYNIPRFSYVQVGGIRFTLMDDIVFSRDTSDTQIIDDNVLLQQGEIKEFTTTAQGFQNERILLNTGKNVVVDHYNIHVYVKSNGKWKKWNPTSSLFLNSGNEYVYDYRMNGSKQYEFNFGNNINGKQLNNGDIVTIFYLQSDGVQGEIASNAFKGKSFVRYKSSNFLEIFEQTATNLNKVSSGILATNTCPSTPFGEMETVDEMRENAPQLFKSQFRLVTENDYLAFIKSNFSNIIQDVKIMGNAEYLDTYMKYFWSLGLTEADWESRSLFNQLYFADSCNFNNVYSFMVPKGSDIILNYLQPSQKALVTNTINEEKTLTSSFLPMDPVYLFMNLAVNGIVKESTDDIMDTYLNIHLNRLSRRNVSDIKKQVSDIFKKYFYKSKCSLGQTIDVVGLTGDILSLDGVDFITTDNKLTGISVDGISFLIWNPSFVDASVKTFTGNIKLEEFQFPFFIDIEYLIDRIIIS